MFPTASTTAIIGALSTSGATIVAYTVTAVIGVALLLVGAGYGWRMLKKHVTGKKI